MRKMLTLSKLLTHFETSPTIGLLRAKNAPYIIDFLNQQFKDSSRIAIPQAELASALFEYVAELHESSSDVLLDKPENYLQEWCSSKNRFLQRHLEVGRDEPVYQLTSHTEEVIGFLANSLSKELGFVGTESRLSLIIETLADLTVGASDDPKQRLRHLRDEAKRIQTEIERIKSEGTVAKYHPAQIRERFASAVTLLRQLQSDFRAVEESFRNITSQVQQRHVGGTETRGKILEFALDAEDLLKREDQGVSFYAFVRLILSPTQTERLEKIIDEVRKIAELSHQQDGMNTIRGMVTILQGEAEKVVRINQRLSATLRRLLDERSNQERLRITQLLRDIKTLALGRAGDPKNDELGISLDVELGISGPFCRNLWVSPPQFQAIDLRAFKPDPDERLLSFQQFAAMNSLPWEEMRLRIKQMLQADEAPTLANLLERFPPESGVIEIIAYLQIASDENHQIDSKRSDIITLAEEGGTSSIRVTIPRVIFATNKDTEYAS